MEAPVEAHERVVLERLKERYETDGYAFFTHPARESVPSFLGGYRPDAIALKGNGGVVIEVMSRKGVERAERLSDLAKLFIAHPDWRFDVLYTDSPMLVPEIGTYPRASIVRELATAERLAEEGNLRAAFLIAWAALEAAVRSIQSEEEGLARPLASNQIPELLAYNGYVDQSIAARLRLLVRTRNAIAHGDIATAASKADNDALVSIAKALLDRSPQPA